VFRSTSTSARFLSKREREYFWTRGCLQENLIPMVAGPISSFRESYLVLP